MTADAFLSDHPKFHSDDRRFLILLLVSLSLAYTICTQKEDDYIVYFEAVAGLSEEHSNEVKLFLNVLIKEVESRGMIVDEGQKIATLKVWIGDQLSQETDLYAAESVEKGGIRRQAIDAVKELLFGWL